MKWKWIPRHFESDWISFSCLSERVRNRKWTDAKDQSTNSHILINSETDQMFKRRRPTRGARDTPPLLLVTTLFAYVFWAFFCSTISVSIIKSVWTQILQFVWVNSAGDGKIVCICSMYLTTKLDERKYYITTLLSNLR